MFSINLYKEGYTVEAWCDVIDSHEAISMYAYVQPDDEVCPNPSFYLRKTLLSKNSGYFMYLKKDLELCSFALERGYVSIKNIPIQYLTPEVLKSQLKRGISLYLIEPHLRTEEMCRFAVDISVHNWRFVPDKFRTVEWCMTMFMKDSNTARYSTNEFLEHLRCILSERLRHDLSENRNPYCAQPSS